MMHNKNNSHFSLVMTLSEKFHRIYRQQEFLHQILSFSIKANYTYRGNGDSTQVAAANFIAPVTFVALQSVHIHLTVFFSLEWCCLANGGDPVEASSEQSIY